jgi:epoxyqueuosine reductase
VDPRTVKPIVRWILQPRIWRTLGLLPSLPRRARRAVASPRIPWQIELPPIPAQLLTVPGERIDPAQEQVALERGRLQSFVAMHYESCVWEIAAGWQVFLRFLSLLARADRGAQGANRERPELRTGSEGELTSELRSYATRLGIGALGVAGYDPTYMTEQGVHTAVGDRVVVLALEQNYAATQAVPSDRSLGATYDSEAESLELTVKLVKFLHARGYRAHAHDKCDGMTIPFAVAAGMGQLGLNGQLLRPAAGSRCRLYMLSTDAPLALDHPVDYGIHGICDRCQSCVRRCPVGAIPRQRRSHRGVEKIKINQKRCFTTVAQVKGCAICMKVCPVQRYGLRAVLDEFTITGRIIGRDTDELEGYDWPLDGVHYGPGQRPRLAPEFHDPRGFDFRPQVVAGSSTGDEL